MRLLNPFLTTYISWYLNRYQGGPPLPGHEASRDGNEHEPSAAWAEWTGLGFCIIRYITCNTYVLCIHLRGTSILPSVSMVW